METKKQIMQAATALKCKTLGKEIQNCDNDKWNWVASEKCFPGILSKFQQNAGIASFLKNTGTKTILECCYDEVWGNGIPPLKSRQHKFQQIYKPGYPRIYVRTCARSPPESGC